MVFFTTDAGSASGIRVTPLWWVYLAVTIPLTMITIAVWLGWLRLVRARKKYDEENLGLKEKAQ